MQHRGGKSCAGRFRLPGVGGSGQRRLLRSLAIAGGGDEDHRDGDGGLDSVVLAAIPVVVLDVGTGNSGDCAVCLTELEPREKARVLWRCGHRFYVECRGGEGGHQVGRRTSRWGSAPPLARKAAMAARWGSARGASRGREEEARDQGPVCLRPRQSCMVQATYPGHRFCLHGVQIAVWL
jgi:hypothetical protein